MSRKRKEIKSKPASASFADVQSWGASEALAAFGDTPKAAHATSALAVGLDFVKRMPVGWNVTDGPEDFAKRCHEYISSNYKPKPVGVFPVIGVWLFWQMISAVITWAVKRLIDAYYPED